MSSIVVAIGDSITYGYPYTHQESWVYLASRRLGIPMINKGEPGETTGEMRQRFAADVLAEKPTHVIIMGGTNDAFYNLPLERVCNNIYRMCEEAHIAGIKPIIGIPVPVNEAQAEAWLKAYRTWLQDFAGRMGFQVLDFYSVLVDSGTGLLKPDCHDDGVHPNLSGYRAMAKIVCVE